MDYTIKTQVVREGSEIIPLSRDLRNDRFHLNRNLHNYITWHQLKIILCNLHMFVEQRPLLLNWKVWYGLHWAHVP